MTKKTRRPKAVDSGLRETLADNVRRLMEARYPAGGSQPRRLAAEAGIALSTLQRLLSCESGASVDTIAAVARVFRMPSYKLLIKAEEARFFIDAREVVGAGRDGSHVLGNRAPAARTR